MLLSDAVTSFIWKVDTSGVSHSYLLCQLLIPGWYLLRFWWARYVTIGYGQRAETEDDLKMFCREMNTDKRPVARMRSFYKNES